MALGAPAGGPTPDEAARPLVMEQTVCGASQALLSVSTEPIRESRAEPLRARRDLRVRQEPVGFSGVTRSGASSGGAQGAGERRRDRQMGGASYDYVGCAGADADSCDTGGC